MAQNYQRPDPTIPGWCDTGEAVQPQSDDIAAGWPDSQIPPSRQEFNWLDKQQDSALRYLCRVAIAEYHPAEQYQGFGLCIGSNRSVYWNLQPCSGIDPVFDNTGRWELTNIRISDADARYLTKSGATELYLTQAQGDARYQLKADMSAFVTYIAGDARYALKTDLAAYVTYPAGDARYALKSDLSNYETVAHAVSTYLKIADAANIYLSKSVAAQTYLTIADANNRFAATTADAHAYTDNSINSAIAAQRAWTLAMLPGMAMRAATVGSGTAIGTWLILTATPNNGSGFEVAFGSGGIQEGDRVTLPPGFTDGSAALVGSVITANGQNTTGDALLNVNFTWGAPGWTAVRCAFTKSNDGNRWKGRGLAFGSWWGFAWRTV
jgi:hypothetical protein